MSMKRRFGSLAISLAMIAGIVLSAGPASAQVVPGTASVDVRNVLAGTQQLFVFSVTNGGSPGIPPVQPAGATIDWVRIGPRVLDGTFSIANGSADGWTFDTTPTGLARFRGGSLAPGQTRSFSVLADAATVPSDLASEWIVEVSDQNGASPVKQTASGTGELTTTIRTLNVDAVNFLAPNGILDGSATANQQGIQITSQVSNHGSQPLNTTPSLSSPGTTVVSVTPATATVDPGAAQTFTFTVDLGGPGTRQFTGGATAPGSTALSNQSPNLLVEAASAFAYNANSLSPVASPSGVAKTFTLSVNKSNPPSVTFDEANTVLTFTKQGDPSQTFSTSLASTAPTGRGNQTVGLMFNPVTIPGPVNVADGLWTPSLSITGTDDNDAGVTRSVSIGNNFEIDNLVPIVLPTLSAPSGQANEFDQPVVKNGNTLTLGGQIKKGPGDLDPVDPSATITQCDLVVLDENFTEVNRINVPISASDCRNDNGAIAGSIAPAALGVQTGFVRLDAAAQDAAGNTSPAASSNLVAVDNVPPAAAEVVTGCGPQGLATAASCDDFKTIRVFLTEGVKGMTLPVDFSVQENVVLNVDTRYINTYVNDKPDQSKQGTACTAMQFCNVAILTLAQSIGEDDTPLTQYAFVTAPTRTRPQDGPRTNLEDFAQSAVDGIVPDLPSLGAVSQSGLDDDGAAVSNFHGNQGGSYYSNQNVPTFRITGLAAGYTGIVALDSNGSGDYERGIDQDLASCVADGATVDCAASSSLAAGTSYGLLIASLDGQSNLSEGRSGSLLGKHARPESLAVDQQAPAAGTLTAAPTSASVSFDEPLARGRDFGEDWIPFVLVDDKRSRFVAGAVSGSDAARNININDGDYQGQLDGILFAYSGEVSRRYQDRAGNYLGDFTLSSP